MDSKLYHGVYLSSSSIMRPWLQSPVSRKETKKKKKDMDLNEGAPSLSPVSSICYSVYSLTQYCLLRHLHMEVVNSGPLKSN